MGYGTLSTLDTLATNLQSIAQIGEDHAYDAVEHALMAQNRIRNELIELYADSTEDRLRRFGTNPNTTMDEIDEFGEADAQKITTGQTVGFPLRAYGATLRWTNIYFKRQNGKEFAAEVNSVLTADRLLTIRQIKRALFYSTNYTMDDRLVDHLSAITLPIKALANADGGQLPAGPNGEFFNGSTHNHYMGSTTSSVDDANITLLINNVAEHFAEGKLVLLINQAQESAFRSLTGAYQFVPYVDSRIVPKTTADVSLDNPLDPVQIYNRAIGIYRGAEVWIKPWVPSGYSICLMSGPTKPLCIRVDPKLGNGDLVLESESDEHPLRAQKFARYFGVGVWDRVAAAVMYWGGTSYVQPTIT